MAASNYRFSNLQLIGRWFEVSNSAVQLTTIPFNDAIAYLTPGIKPINGIIAAVILYFVLSKVIPQTSNRRAIDS